MTAHDGTAGMDDATLSALVDGELAPDESRRALERIARDARLQARWARYHAVRAACEGAAGDHLPAGFSARVHEALANEPTVRAPRTARAAQRLRNGPIARFAIAASAALVAVGGIMTVQWQEGAPAMNANPAAIEADRLAAADGIEGIERASLTKMLARTPANGRRLSAYLARHSQYASAGGMPDLVPLSRLTSLNAAR